MSDATDWIGAIGSIGGALGTTGALLLGLQVYRRQEDDQRRAQASAITVSMSEPKNRRDLVETELRNDSALPIYSVRLIASLNGKDLNHNLKAALPPGGQMSFQLVHEHGMSARAVYLDSAGRKWRRYFNGDLEEIKGPGSLQRLHTAFSPAPRSGDQEPE